MSDEIRIQLKNETENHNQTYIRLTAELTDLKAKYQKAIEALKFECGNRCAEQNPCNAKETLAELGEKR